MSKRGRSSDVDDLVDEILSGGEEDLEAQQETEGGLVDFDEDDDNHNNETEAYYEGNSTQFADTEVYDVDEDDDDVGIDIDEAFDGDEGQFNSQQSSSSQKNNRSSNTKEAWSFLNREDENTGAATGNEDEDNTNNMISDDKLRKYALKIAQAKLTRPASSYIVFSTKMRSTLDASLSFKEKATSISTAFHAMSEEEKADLEAECKVAKDLYEVKLQAAADEEVELLRNDPIALEAAFSSKKINDINFNALDHTRPITLPLAKIKRIIKMNPDVKNCGKEASIMITKACEIFTAYIGFKAANLSNLRGAKTIQERDFVHMIHTNEHTDFLREDFPRRQGEDGSKPKSKPKTGANNMVTTTVTNDDGSMTTVEVDASEIATDKMKLANEKKMAAISVGSSKLTGFFNRGDAGVGKSSALAVSSNASSTGGSKNSQDMFSKYASSPSSSKSPLTEAAAEDTEAEGKSIASQMTEPYNFNYTSTARFEDD